MADTRVAGASPRFVLLVAALLGVALLQGGQTLDAPGLYYDEAVQARPAREFVNGVVYGTVFPGSRTVEVGGRRFPWMTQPYMGALKSQALIPSVWMFGASVSALRLTTLVWALAGVALIAAFARRCFGERTALIAALLLAFDPSLLLLARHDWGSFAVSLLLRGAALWLLWRWWETRRAAFLAVGAAMVGLGLYNKVDFSVFLAAGGIGVLACAAGPLLARVREAPQALAVAAGGLLLGMSPLLPSIASVFAARSAFSQAGEGAEKLRTLVGMLDGSYFERLMQVGGLFDRMQTASSSVGSLFGAAFAIALLGVPVLVARASRRPGANTERTAGLFLVVASVVALLGYFALPGGVRIHHALNIYPYPHLLVAWMLATLSERGRTARTAALATAAVVAISGSVATAKTLAFSAETGGLGRWSHAMNDFAAELGSDESTVIVSLDWGFHENFGFLTEGPRLLDAYPRIPSALAQRGAWGVEGTPGHVYLVHEEPYDLFGYGKPFLEAVARVEAGRAVVRRHVDRRGDTAFVSVRFTGDHQLVFRPRGFEIHVED